MLEMQQNGSRCRKDAIARVRQVKDVDRQIAMTLRTNLFLT